ncbi:MAG: hypothetical protein VX444_15435 [Pseudomonadota bacterium]|nr:hypothetical protein [Pseudomonadota bacterium]
MSLFRTSMAQSGRSESAVSVQAKSTPMNDWNDDFCRAAAPSLPQVQSNAAPAKVKNPRSALSAETTLVRIAAKVGFPPRE